MKRDLNIIYPSNSPSAFSSQSSPSSSSSSLSSPYSTSSYSFYSPSSPYSQSTPFLSSPTPIPELSNPELLNEISYVYPESYSVQDNTIQPFSSTSLQPIPTFSEESVSSDPAPETLNPVDPTLEPVDPTLHPVDITLDTIDPIDNSNPFDPTLDPVFSFQPDEIQEIFARSSNVPESTSTPETANTEADEYDYENWSVVVNVIKSVSDSATSVTLSSDSIEYKTLSSDPTDESTWSKFDNDTAATLVTEVYSPATESSSETATIPFTSPQEEETTQQVDEKDETVSEINLFPARTRFGEKRPGLFNLQHHAESPEIKNKTLSKPIHPFFNQIRSSSHNPRNISKFFNSTTISPFTLGSSSTSTSLAPSTATSRASLFGRLSRNRFNPFSTSGEKSSPVTEESTELIEASEETEPDNLIEPSTESPAPNTTPATTDREETKSKLLKNLKSRLSNFKRPRPFSRNSITQTKEKEEEGEKENSEDITEEENDITEEVDEEEDSEDLNTIEDLVDKPKPSSVTSLLRRPSFIRPSLNSLTPQEFKVPVSSPVEKPRPKRLPAPFSGSRSSLFSNRFKSRPEITSEPVRTEPIITELTQDDTNDQNLDNKSVGDLIAQLNQDENIDESSATLRPRAFKPKSGVSNKIREKLQAELSKDEDDENQNEEDMEEEDKEVLPVQSSTEAETSGRVLPVRRRVFSRLESTSSSPPPVFNSAISRFRTRQRLQSSKLSPSSSSSSSSPAPVVSTQTSITDTTEEILYSTDILDIFDQTIDTTEVQETTVDTMHVGDIDSLITTITSFQVSDSQDSVMELSTDPSPTLSQVLVLVTQSTLTTDEDTTTAPGVESTPDTMEPIPFTAPVFLPTVDQTVFLPTLSRDSEPSSSVSNSITTPETISTSTQPSRSRSRAQVRGNLRTVQANNIQTGDQPRQDEASEIRTPVRFRARVRTQPISGSTEKTENTELSEVPRSSGTSSHSPRRFISRTNSFDSTPEFKSGRKRLNQNLKVRGRGRSTAAPELLETIPPEAEPELKNIEEPVVKPARGKGKVGKDVVSTAVENIYTGELQVDSPVTVVSTDQELDSDASTSRTRGFTPKFGDTTRNKLREKLLQELNKTREFEAKEGSTEMPLEKVEEDEYRIIDEVNNKPAEERKGGFRPTPHSILRPRAHKRPDLDFSRSEDYQDPRLKRQNEDLFVTEASFSSLRRAGRSTLGSQGFTENPLKLQDLEESSITSLIQDKDFNPTGIKPFLLRGGKGERNLFPSRYSEETEHIEKSSKPDIYLKFNSVPQKESLLKTKPFKKFNPKLEFGSKMLKELVESGSGQVLPVDKVENLHQTLLSA